MLYSKSTNPDLIDFIFITITDALTSFKKSLFAAAIIATYK